MDLILKRTPYKIDVENHGKKAMADLWEGRQNQLNHAKIYVLVLKESDLKQNDSVTLEDVLQDFSIIKIEGL